MGERGRRREKENGESGVFVFPTRRPFSFAVKFGHLQSSFVFTSKARSSVWSNSVEQSSLSCLPIYSSKPLGYSDTSWRGRILRCNHLVVLSFSMLYSREKKQLHTIISHQLFANQSINQPTLHSSTCVHRRVHRLHYSH